MSKDHLTNEEIWGYIDTRWLAPEKEKHLVKCVNCRQRVAEFKAIDLELNDLVENTPSMSFASKVVRRWEDSKSGYPLFVAAIISVFTILLVTSLVLSLQIESLDGTSLVQWFTLILIILSFWLWDSLRSHKLHNDVRST